MQTRISAPRQAQAPEQVEKAGPPGGGGGLLAGLGDREDGIEPGRRQKAGGFQDALEGAGSADGVIGRRVEAVQGEADVQAIGRSVRQGLEGGGAAGIDEGAVGEHGAGQSLARGFEKGRTLGRAPRIVLLGSPNAGKASLINALVEEERLLVSDVPGTTRDYVEVPLHLAGGLVHLVDTAGLGKPVDGLDAMAMKRTRLQGERADLRVLVRDGTSDAPEPGFSGEGGFALRIATRSDLQGFLAPDGYLRVSNLTKQGLSELVARLEVLAFRGDPVGEEVVLTTQRQFQSITEARDRVRAAYANLETRPAIEIIAFEIKEAAGHLRELLGEISTEQVLRKIFTGFCIGK